MNPLEWSSDTFFEFYIPLLPFALAAAFLYKDCLNQPAGIPTPEQLDMDPYLMAALLGEETVVKTVLVMLTHQGVMSGDADAPRADKPLPREAVPLEKAVYGAVKSGKRSTEQLREAVRPVLIPMRGTLLARGMLRTAEQDIRYQWYPLLLFLAVLGLGVARLGVSIARGRPVGCLVRLLRVGVGLARLLCWNHPASRQGIRAVRMLRRENVALYDIAHSEGGTQTMTPAQLALAVGLFGSGSLARLRDPAQRESLFPPPDSGDGGG